MKENSNHILIPKVDYKKVNRRFNKFMKEYKEPKFIFSLKKGEI